MAERPVTFSSADGLKLEGLLDEGGPKGWAVLLHPHPLYGGEMRSAVIEALQKAALREGFSTLRFNFRGVGSSEGSYGEGVREREDLRGAIDYLHSLGEKGPLIVAGYSFGSHVASAVAVEDERIDGLALISPPLSMDDFGLLGDYAKPKLVVAGDRDFVCPLEDLQGFFSRLSEPKVLKIIQGCDHFYAWGMHTLAGKAFGEFLRDFFVRDEGD